MAIKLVIQKDTKQVVVPIRVDRAVRGTPLVDAPDVDDRAFLPNLPKGVNKDDARGAVFSMTVGDTVRVRIVREDIDSTAPLFAVAGKSSNPQFQVVDPANGGPLPSNGEFKIKAVDDNLTPQKLEIRMGSKTGPVIAEASPHIFSPFTLNITPHLVRLSRSATAPGAGVFPTLDGANLETVLDQLFDMARAIWRPAAVKLNVGAVVKHELFGCQFDDRSSLGDETEVGSERHIVTLGHKKKTCNIYFVMEMTNKLGIGVNRDAMPSENFQNPAILVASRGTVVTGANGFNFTRPSTGAAIFQEVGNDLAHEIGHFLTLVHADDQHGTGPPDTYNRRHLMHANNPLGSADITTAGSPRFDDIGYGMAGTQGHRGCLLTLKKHPEHKTNPDVLNARKRIKDAANLY